MPQLPPFYILPVIISDVLKIFIVTFANNISVATVYAKRNKYEISPNQVWKYLNFFWNRKTKWEILNINVKRRNSWLLSYLFIVFKTNSPKISNTEKPKSDIFKFLLNTVNQSGYTYNELAKISDKIDS